MPGKSNKIPKKLRTILADASDEAPQGFIPQVADKIKLRKLRLDNPEMTDDQLQKEYKRQQIEAAKKKKA